GDRLLGAAADLPRRAGARTTRHPDHLSQWLTGVDRRPARPAERPLHAAGTVDQPVRDIGATRRRRASAHPLDRRTGRKHRRRHPAPIGAALSRARTPPMSRIALVVSDVDGTLLTKDKILTERAIDAVRRLHEAGIGFTITSSRPTIGMRFLIE